MKLNFYLVVYLFTSSICIAQDTIITNSIVLKNTHVIGFSPMSRKVEEINGFVFGVGHIDNKYVVKQTINGFNLEVNPAPAIGAFIGFFYIMYLPEIIEKNSKRKDNVKINTEPSLKILNWNKTPHLKINGLNISTGCFFTTTSMNGLNISLANKFNNFNGISITPLGTIINNQNGISIGLINANNNLKGSVFGVYNQTYKLDGAQFGIVNFVRKNSGIQIGVFNRSFSRGFQIGLWNKNSKRSFPVINW